MIINPVNTMLKRIVNTDRNDIDLSLKYIQSDWIKPSGLWYSLNGEWKTWCQVNMPEYEQFNNISISINLEEILIIKDYHELQHFNFWYSNNNSIMRYIDWVKVSKDYAGIEFQNIRKLVAQSKELDKASFWWLWTWDVSGGCIWDLSVISHYSLEYHHE